MVPGLAYRLILLGLLPVIALLIYQEGQKYDRAIIQFSTSPEESDALSSFFPEEITPFSLTGPVRTYTKDNLYEYVNGHAEYFISAGFSSLAVGEYSIKENDKRESDAVVDIYDMGKSIQSYGVLSDESGGGARKLSSGLTGFRTLQGVSFVKDRYYVKISAYNEDVNPEVFAEIIGRQISAGEAPSSEFSRFPEIGGAVQTRFIKEAYRGLDFLSNVVEREYHVNGEVFQISLFAEEEREITNRIQSFLNFFSESGVEYDTIASMGKTIYEVKDPYEGDWMLIPRSEALFGVYGSYNERVINALLAGSPE